MSIDYLRIKDKLNQSKDYFLIIDRILDKESNNLKSDIEQQMVAERAFEIISQIIIDVCTHIVAKMRLSTPSNYADCINKLVENNIIQPEYKQKLKNLIRMRNLIVHQYDNIDYGLLFDALRTLREDFGLFKKAILAWIQDKNKV